MTLKHYKLSKTIIRLVIYVSIFSAFAQSYIISSNYEGYAQAADTCNASSQPASVNISSPKQATITVDFSRTLLDRFHYKVTAVDNTNNANNPLGSTIDVDVPEGTSVPRQATINNATGENIVTVVFTTYEDPAKPCIHAPITRTVTTGSTSRGISLDVTNGDIKFGESTDIRYSFTGHQGDTYTLFVADCDGTFYQKDFGSILGDPWPAAPNNYLHTSFTPGEDTSCSHAVWLKTFASGATDNNDKAVSSIIVTDSKGTVPTDIGGDTVDPDANDIKIPDSVDTAFGKLNLPKYNGTVSRLIEIVIELILYLIGVLAFFSLVVGGIQYITSGGDSSKAEKAKKTLLYSVIGILLTSMSLSIIYAVQKLPSLH